MLIIAIGIAALVIGCGEGDGADESLLTENDLRRCLTEAGLQVEPPGGPDSDEALPPLGSAVPDLVLFTEEGAVLSVYIERTPERAERVAADIEASLLTFGSADREVVRTANAIALFDREPSDKAAEAVETCAEA